MEDASLSREIQDYLNQVREDTKPETIQVISEDLQIQFRAAVTALFPELKNGTEGVTPRFFMHGKHIYSYADHQDDEITDMCIRRKKVTKDEAEKMLGKAAGAGVFEGVPYDETVFIRYQAGPINPIRGLRSIVILDSPVIEKELGKPVLFNEQAVDRTMIVLRDLKE